MQPQADTLGCGGRAFLPSARPNLAARAPLRHYAWVPRKAYLTATLPDGYVKTIGPTSVPFTHYWRIVAVLANGRTEVFWGHTRSLAEAKRKRAATADAARTRGWAGHRFEIVALESSAGLPPRPASR